MNIIVNFHRVTSSQWVERMVNLLKSRFRLVDAESVYQHYRSDPSLNNFCHITVDDGDRSFYDVIYPVLKRHRVPCSVYVSPRICKEKSNFWFQEVARYEAAVLNPIIGEVSGIPLPLVTKYNTFSVFKMLPLCLILEIIRKYQATTRIGANTCQNISVTELLELKKSGLVTIGAHTLNHPILQNENDSGSKYEIEESLKELSDLLGHRVEYFAYPNGLPGLDFSEREKLLLEKTGVKLAFSTATSTIGRNLDAMSVPRVGVSDCEALPFTKLKLYAAFLCGSYSRFKPHSEYRERRELRRAMSTS